MARLDILDVEVTIEVDGVPLEEFEDRVFDIDNENRERPNDDLMEPRTSPAPSTSEGSSTTHPRVLEPDGSDPTGRDLDSEADIDSDSDLDVLTEQPRLIEISKFIAPVSEKEYTVKCSFGKDFPYKNYGAIAGLTADGKLKTNLRFHREKLKRLRSTTTRIFKGKPVQNDLHHFYFSRLRLAEDALITGSESQIGTIVVEMWRYKPGKRNRKRKRRDHSPIPGQRTINEKSIKKTGAISHSTGLRRPTPSKLFIPLPARYIDGRNHPFARFIFKYRNKEFLQAHKIISRVKDSIYVPDDPTEDIQDDIEDIKPEIKVLEPTRPPGKRPPSKRPPMGSIRLPIDLRRVDEVDDGDTSGIHFLGRTTGIMIRENSNGSLFIEE